MDWTIFQKGYKYIGLWTDIQAIKMRCTYIPEVIEDELWLTHSYTNLLIRLDES